MMMSSRGIGGEKTDQEEAILVGELHQNSDFVALLRLGEQKKGEREEKAKACTLKNIRSPGSSAAQFFKATHLPIPPFLANLVQREN